MSKKLTTSVWKLIIGLFILLLGLYGFFPFILSWYIERELEQNGFEQAVVELGYPRWQSTSVNVLSFQKATADQTLHITVRNVDLEYQIPKIFSGVLDRIYVSDASLEFIPNSTNNRTTPSTDPSPTLSEIKTTSDLTLGEIVKPLPSLPFQQLILEKVTIKQAQTSGPLQQVHIWGSLINDRGTVTGTFTFEGEHIPRYKLLIAGKQIGDMHITMQLPSSPSTTVVSFHSTLTALTEKNIQLQGTLETDVKELLSFLSLLVPLNNELKLLSGEITTHWSGVFPKSTSMQSVLNDKAATIQGTLRLNLENPAYASFGKDISIALDGSFATREGQMMWTLSDTSNVSAQIDVQNFPLPETVRSMLPEGSHPFLIDLPQPVNGRLSFRNPQPSLALDGPIRAQYGTQHTPLTLQVALNNLSGQLGEHMKGLGKFTISSFWRPPPQGSLPAKTVKCNLAGKVAVNDQDLHITLAPASFLETVLHPIGDIKIPHASVTLASEVPVIYQAKTGAWKVEPARINLHLPKLYWQENPIAIQKTRLSINTLRGTSSMWKTQGGVRLMGLSPQLEQFTPPTTNWALKFSANPSGVILAVFGQTFEMPLSVKGRLQQNFNTKEGALKLTVPPLLFSSETFLLSQLLKDWSYPFDITAGQISATANVSWKPDKASPAKNTTVSQARASLAVEDVDGYYQKVVMNDFSTAITVEGIDTWSMPNPAKIMIKEIKSGIDVHNLTMTVQASSNPTFNPYMVHIKDLSANILGGTLSSEEIMLDSTRTHNSFTANLQHIEVEEILKLEQQQDLHGTGILDGVIPVRVTQEGGVEVHEGAVEARPPGGLIRFQPAAETANSLSQTNSKMNLVLQVLNNFHYDTLKIGVDYQQDGTLNLQTRLEGKNPDLMKGQPIHFNLNIEENVPALLQSLQIVTGIEELIERMVQQPFVD